MLTSLFDYTLPDELIATEPPAERDGARLLVLEGESGLVESTTRDLASFVPEGSLVIVNDTRVMKARLLGHKVGSGGKTEIFLVKRASGDEWLALGKASKSLRDGTEIRVGSLHVRVVGRDHESGLLRVALSVADGSSVDEAIRREGTVPLPPYIKRPARESDEERYQTVFAREEGAVAAPTAGLHVTKALLGRLEQKGVTVASVTLHVGLGTFSPVTVDDLDDHDMHAETYTVPKSTVRAVAEARERGAKVVAIGTTVVRALESARDLDRPGHLRQASGEETRLLIQPGYRFSVVDALLTNFHLPKSTLLALVCAFGGHERVLAAYRHAVRTKMRFYSYGDAMFLERANANAKGAHS